MLLIHNRVNVDTALDESSRLGMPARARPGWFDETGGTSDMTAGSAVTALVAGGLAHASTHLRSDGAGLRWHLERTASCDHGREPACRSPAKRESTMPM